MHFHQQYPVSDLYQWIKSNSLILAPEFQRGNIWSTGAKSYFIDSILRDLPVPPIYIRNVTDPVYRTSYRQVVDGQQRLRTIQAFIDGALTLDKYSKEFAGKTYDTLDEEDQRRFLAYQIGTEQLFEADDDTVLDIFHRINNYSLTLNRQELRHSKFLGGKFKGEFRWAVISAAERWEVLWSKYLVVSVRSRVRLGDHELVAQLFGILLDGVTDGGQPKIDKLYERNDAAVPEGVEQSLDQVCRYILNHFETVLETKLGSGPHFMMVFAAVAHALLGISKGDMGGVHPELPERDSRALTDAVAASENLLSLADVFDMDPDDVPERLKTFKIAIAGTTQRIRSRSLRFVKIYQALLPDPI